MNWSSGEDVTGQAGEKHNHEHEEHNKRSNLRARSTQVARGQQDNITERSLLLSAEPSAAISSTTSTASNKYAARPHPCAHCNKKYELRKDLTRHNKQSRCAKDRLATGAHAAVPSLDSIQNDQSPNPAAGRKRKAAESLVFDLEQPDPKTARTAGPEVHDKLESEKRVSRKKPPIHLRTLLSRPFKSVSSSDGDNNDPNSTNRPYPSPGFSSSHEFPAADQDGLYGGLYRTTLDTYPRLPDQLDIDGLLDVTELNSWPLDMASQQVQQSPQQPQPAAIYSPFPQPPWDIPLDGSLLAGSSNNIFTSSVWSSTNVTTEPPFEVPTHIPTTEQYMRDLQSLNASPPLTSFYGPDYLAPTIPHTAVVRYPLNTSPLALQQSPDGHPPGDYELHPSLTSPHQQSPILQQAPEDIPSSASLFPTTHPWEFDPSLFSEDQSQVPLPNWLSQQNPLYSEQQELEMNNQEGVGNVDPPPFDWNGQRDQNVTGSVTQIQELSHSPLDLSRPQPPPATRPPPRFKRQPSGVASPPPVQDFSINQDDASSRRSKSGRPPMDVVDDPLEDIGKSNPHSMAPRTAVGVRGRMHNPKVPGYPNSTIPMTVIPSSLPITADTDTTLNLRIKGLTCDARHQRDEFTNITVGRSQKFGPTLNHYCEEQGKHYMTEWNFVYWYRTPTPEDPDKQCGHNLSWHMTPDSFVPSDQFPHRPMNDGDVIELFEGTPSDHFEHDVHFDPPDLGMDQASVNARAKVNTEPVLNRADEAEHDHDQDQDSEQNDEQTVRWLQKANTRLHKENQKLQDKFHAVDRLQTAYDTIRRAYEKQRHENIDLHRSNAELREENTTLLRHEDERLSGTSLPPHGLPMAQINTPTLNTPIEVPAPVPRYPVRLPHSHRSQVSTEETKRFLQKYSDSDDHHSD